MDNADRELKVVHQLLQWIEYQVEIADDCKLRDDLQFTIRRYRDYQLETIRHSDDH